MFSFKIVFMTGEERLEDNNLGDANIVHDTQIEVDIGFSGYLVSQYFMISCIKSGLCKADMNGISLPFICVHILKIILYFVFISFLCARLQT